MDEARRARLEVLMAGMAAGDLAAVFTLAVEFGDQITAVVRRHLRDLGAGAVDRDDLAGLVTDACLALYDCAAGWRIDGGALPWTWADRRLRAVAARFVGIHAEELCPDGREPASVAALVVGRASADLPAGAGAGAGADADELAVLRALAGRRPECALLLEALERVANARDRTIVLSVKLQAALGDPSPAVTVAREHGLRPDAVRQVVKRGLDRLRTLAARDERFAPLADLALLA